MCFAQALGISTQTHSMYPAKGKSVEIDNADAGSRLILCHKSAVPSFLRYVVVLTIVLQVRYTTDRPRSSRRFPSKGYISDMGVDNTRICRSDRLRPLSIRDRCSRGLDDTSLLWRPTLIGRVHISRRQVRAGEGQPRRYEALRRNAEMGVCRVSDVSEGERGTSCVVEASADPHPADIFCLFSRWVACDVLWTGPHSL